MNPVSAALLFYTDRSVFKADAPGLPIETFENNHAVSDVTTFAPPLNSSTNNAAFAPNDIWTGLSIAVLNNGGSGDLDLLKPASAVNPVSDVVGPKDITDALEISFYIPVNAIGFDLMEFANTTDLLTVSFYNQLALLGSIEVQPTRVAMFVGAISDTDVITRIRSSFGNIGEAVDNIAFGVSNSEPPGNPVPTPGSLILFSSGLLMLFRKNAKKIIFS